MHKINMTNKKIDYGLELLNIADRYKTVDFVAWERVRTKIMTLVLAKEYAIKNGDVNISLRFEKALKNVYENMNRMYL